VTPFDEAVLWDCLEAARAYERVHDPEHSSNLAAEELLELCRAAGYPEEVCQKAATERALARMRRELEP
jgi:hypothetical protein